jgi:hypothetical protein
MWPAPRAAAWDGKKLKNWAGRESVLMAQAKDNEDVSLRFDAKGATDETRGALRVTTGARFLLVVQVKGGTRLKIQVFSRKRKMIWSATAPVAEGDWRALKLPLTGFRSLDGNLPLPEDVPIDFVGLFLEGPVMTDPLKNADRWLALAEMKMLPKRIHTENRGPTDSF